ncbi:MAG: sugar phosphate isomerase/epimerase [Actinomycetota bacterium]|nr:sugar phosphate isomerase/epimerase [Actinomycetota bacterium]
MTGIRVGNAPLSYGAFEVTVGRYPNVPGPDELLAQIAAAGYAGTELGPPGYLGEHGELRKRLAHHRLELTGGWCPVRFSEPKHWDEDLAQLERTLSLFAAAEGTAAHPVFGDGGSQARVASPGRGQADRSLGLDDAGWKRWAEGVARAVHLAAEAGFQPTLHAHTATYVEAPWEIDRALELTDIGLLVDTGHLLIGGTDPVQALRDWGERVNYVHVKDVRMDVLRGVVADRADMIEAWRRGVFCELGKGDVDLDGFFAALRDTGYEGWIVVEQDRIPRPDEELSESAEAQVRNRNWLREHAAL